MATRKKMQQSSEEARHKPFQALQLELQEAGYLEQNITFSSTRAITLGLLCALPFVALWGVIYRLFLIDRAQLSDAGGSAFYIMVLIITAVSVFIHELLHGFGWAIFGKKGWTAIHFNISALMPTCTCQAALTKRQYLAGVLAPFLVLGLGSAAFLLIYPGTVSVVTMMVNFVAAGADLMIAISVCRQPKDVLIADHPSQAGYMAYSKIDVSYKK